MVAISDPLFPIRDRILKAVSGNPELPNTLEESIRTNLMVAMANISAITSSMKRVAVFGSQGMADAEEAQVKKALEMSRLYILLTYINLVNVECNGTDPVVMNFFIGDKKKVREIQESV